LIPWKLIVLGLKPVFVMKTVNPAVFLNFYVNSEDIRFLKGTNTVLADGDEVSIVPAVAGG